MLKCFKGLVTFVHPRTLSSIHKNCLLFYKMTVKKDNSHNDIRPNQYAPFLTKKNPSTQTRQSAQQSSNNKSDSSQRQNHKQRKIRDQPSNDKRMKFTKSVNDFILEGRQKQQFIAKMNQKSFQKQILTSEFHRFGMMDIKYKVNRDKLLSTQKIELQLRKQLHNCLNDIIDERQRLVAHEFTDQWFNQEYQKYLNKQHSFINLYLSLYIKLESIVGDILVKIIDKNHKQLQIHAGLLDIINCFRLTQLILSYDTLLTKLTRSSKLNTIKQISKQDAQFCVLTIDKRYDMNAAGIKSIVSRELYSSLNTFHKTKLPLILSHYSNHPFKWKVLFLQKIQTIFEDAHLVYGKQFFYLKFVHQNFTSIDELLFNKQLPQQQDIDIFVKLFLFSAKSLVLDHQIILKFNSIMEKLTYYPKLTLSLDQTNKIMQIYIRLGHIPSSVYNKWISKYLFSLVQSKNPNKITFALKFFLYSNCQDTHFLQSNLKSFDSIVTQSTNISSRNMKKQQFNLVLHLMFHYLCIKYPQLQNNQASKKFLNQCWSYYDKDLALTNKILDCCSRQSKEIRSNEVFVSPCMRKEKSKITKANQSHGLSRLQENILGDNIQFVLKQLNEPSKDIFYQLKRNIPICIFELDFVVLKWDSPKKQKLLKYINIESVGIQYCYDSNDCQSDDSLSKKLYEMSILDYEKGLILQKKKQVRSEILKHYGWKIIHVPNKYTYINLIDRKTLQTKLRQAIQAKTFEM